MVILIILDGYGIREADRYNAVTLARKPNLDRLFEGNPHTQLGASGRSVGLPEGQMGNSEVGHLNIGAGRVVYQEITRIDKSIEEGDFFKNPALVEAMERAQKNKVRLHLLGLVSNGGVHSSIEHLFALLKTAKQCKVPDVFVHAFLDGRDCPPTSGAGFVQQVLDYCRKEQVGELASICGRYWAMDRDQRWERTSKAYRLLVTGEGLKTADPVAAVKEFYVKRVTDEFMEPIYVEGKKPNLIADGDQVIFFNFRTDRGRQLSFMLTEKDLPAEGVKKKPGVDLCTLTHYDDQLQAAVAFPQMTMTNLFGEVMSKAGKRQLRIAETEKYPHVTFFFNGQNEKPYPREDRILIPSPKVPTYDLQPQMSAPEVTEKVVEAVLSKRYDVIILNYANPDMVGHTGVLKAAVTAVETVDAGVGRVMEAISKAGGTALITADHGNCETMWDASTNGPHTAHTTNPVPCTLVAPEKRFSIRPGGILADIAPTFLEFLKLPQPKEMTGSSLLAND
ncbi:MAG TPA: 2,3-bisphosphoglycerate-independent phosphoglycerate mutase [candidate division Zixibacteria bacterium]|nr:2,3-bisphosphoglycerate-independent phosphoglycerate mutase [candidate division Zixibacteria bacterium]